MEASGACRNKQMAQKESKGLVTLNQIALQEMVSDVYQRADIEACGVLIGSLANDYWYVEQAYPLRNIAHSAVYFEFAPEDLLAVELAYPGQVIGVYHSHPTGYARASRTDQKNMRRINLEQAIPWVWLIICGPFDESTQQEDLWDCRGDPLRSPTGYKQRITAYHHYEERGLQTIPIHCMAVSSSDGSKE
jgi:proteasome lid subunit RPN8/RPN11